MLVANEANCERQARIAHQAVGQRPGVGHEQYRHDRGTIDVEQYELIAVVGQTAEKTVYTGIRRHRRVDDGLERQHRWEPIQRAIRINEAGTVEAIYPEMIAQRSQDLEEAWHDVGQFYWGRTGAWMTVTNLFGPATAAIHLPSWRVQDIDTEDDWRRAEMLAQILSDDTTRPE